MSGDRSNKKMREKIERRKRYLQQKAYSDALKRGPSNDPELTERQRKFSMKLIQEMLVDEQCYSFSKPVTELWDISELPGYFDKVKKPMDLGTILENLEEGQTFNADKTGMFDFRLFVEDVHLVFKNCLEYNEGSTDLAKLSRRLMAYFDRRVREIPFASEEKPSKDEPMDDKESDGDAGGDEKSDAKESDEDEDKHVGASGEERDVVDGASAGETDDQAEIDKLTSKIGTLKKLKGKVEGTLAEIEMERNMPMTAEERMALRDEVESADWSKVEKVGAVLRKHVKKAVEELGKDEDPEYVMLELNEIEPSLLREVEGIVKPDPRREVELRKLDKIRDELEENETRLKTLRNGKRRR